MGSLVLGEACQGDRTVPLVKSLRGAGRAWETGPGNSLALTENKKLTWWQWDLGSLGSGEQENRSLLACSGATALEQ